MNKEKNCIKEKFNIDGKEVTLYPAQESSSPLIVLNQYDGDGAAVLEQVRKLTGKDFHLLCVSNINWNHDMSPWFCPPIMSQDTAYTGGADQYLTFLLEEILPEGLKRLNGQPSRICIAGYSLAGLFALYALYRTEVFDSAASMSGSLWYPDFREYVESHEMKKRPDKLYLSLGDKEAKTRNPYMKTVLDNTEAIAAYYRAAGLQVTMELNPGNHFRDAELRIAKGIAGIL